MTLERLPLLVALAGALTLPPASHAASAPLLAVGDADMAPTAYVDNNLDPRVPGSVDRLFTVDPMDGDLRSVRVSNAVTGPALSVDKSRDGRLAVVVETTGPAPAGATRFDQLPPGRQITLLRVRAGERPVVIDRIGAPSEPTTAEFSPDGKHILVASRDERRPISVIELRGDRFGKRRDFGLTVPGGPRIAPGVAAAATWRPDGKRFAVVLEEQRREVLFYSFALRRDRPAVGFAGGPVQVEPRPFGGFYTPDGRTFIANSIRVGGGSPVPDPGTPLNPADFLGSLAVIDVTGRPRVVQAVPTPIFPEGLAISPDGRRVATVNLQTSSLPPAHPLFSSTSSVSLWSLDQRAQRLTKLGGDVTFEGVLPEGLDWDPSGRRLAVATYQRNWTGLQNEGAVDIWRLDAARTAPTLERRIRTMRGVHSVAWAR